MTFTQKYKYLIAFALITICVGFAFCFHITELGFYVDDWIALQAYSQDGADGIIAYGVRDNRPNVAWILLPALAFAGTNALKWQCINLFFRILTGFSAFLLLDRFFPKKVLSSILFALLFVVYPIFLQQPLSITYLFHWVCYFLFNLSLWFNLLALRTNKFAFLWLIPAILCSYLQLRTNEYYLGLELARPIILFLFLLNNGNSLKQSVKKAFVYWCPLLMALGLYLFWRFFLMEVSGTDRNTPLMLIKLLKTPADGIPLWADMFFRSMKAGLIDCWKLVFDFANFRYFRESWQIAGMAFLVFSALFLLLARKVPNERNNAKTWLISGVLTGLILMILGFLPGWGINRVVDFSQSKTDRFGLAAMLGAALVFVSLAEGLIRNQKIRLIFLVVLISAAIGYQNRILMDYVYSWRKQQIFTSQLHLRAPMVEPNTFFVQNRINGKGFGSWADIMTINQMYDPYKLSETNSYWLDTAETQELKNALEDGKLSAQNKFMHFYGNIETDLIVLQHADNGNCLWLLDAKDQNNPYISKNLLPFLKFSNLSRIIPDSDHPYRADIYGTPNISPWCTLYQSAKVAQQNQDWEKINTLFADTLLQGLIPLNPTELEPFIEAAALSGDLSHALSMSRQAQSASGNISIDAYLCDLWERIAENVPDTVADVAVQAWHKGLQCQSLP